MRRIINEIGRMDKDDTTQSKIERIMTVDMATGIMVMDQIMAIEIINIIIIAVSQGIIRNTRIGIQIGEIEMIMTGIRRDVKTTTIHNIGQRHTMNLREDKLITCNHVE